MCMWNPWKRNRELEERVTNAQEEVKVARHMLSKARQAVVPPLVTSEQQDRYSDTIRDALIKGYGSKKQT